MNNLWQQKETIYNNENRSIVVVEQAPHVQKYSTIEKAIPINIGYSLDDCFEFSY